MKFGQYQQERNDRFGKKVKVKIKYKGEKLDIKRIKEGMKRSERRNIK